MRKAREAEQQKKNDEEAARRERLKDIDDDLAKRLRRAEEDAERRRIDAKDAHTKAMADLQEQWAEERQARQEQFEEQRDDEKAAAKKSRADAWAGLKEKITDLKKHYAERNMIAKAQALQDSINELLQMDQTSQEAQDLHREINDSFHEFVQNQSDDIADLVEAYQELGRISEITLPIINGIDGGGGGETVTPPPVGGGLPPGCDVGVSAGLSVGMTCGQPPTQVICDKNGNKFVCVDGKLASHAGSNRDVLSSPDTQQTQQTSNNLPSSFFGGTSAGGATLPVQGSGQIPVTIQVTGDKTLDQIFREISYDAFIEVVGE